MSIEDDYDRLSTSLEFDVIHMIWEEAPAEGSTIFASKYSTLDKQNVIISVVLRNGLATVEATRWRRYFARASFPFSENSTINDILLDCLNNVVNTIDSKVVFIYPHKSVKLTDECLTEPMF